MPVAGMWARTEAWAFVVAEGGVVWFGEEANSVAEARVTLLLAPSPADQE